MLDYSKLLYDDIKQIVKDIYQARNPTETMGGTVTATEPTQVVLDLQDDPLPKGQVVVPHEYSPELIYEDVTIEVSEGRAEVIGGEGGYVDLAGKTIKGKVIIDNSLKEGDKVLMVRGQDGQRFVITGKVD